jgi:hypothetical protein
MRTSGLILVLTLGPFVAPLAAKAPPAKVPQMGVFSPLVAPAVPDWKQYSPIL